MKPKKEQSQKVKTTASQTKKINTCQNKASSRSENEVNEKCNSLCGHLRPPLKLVSPHKRPCSNAQQRNCFGSIAKKKLSSFSFQAP